MPSHLKEELDYYVQHQDEFVRQYNGRVVVIKGKQVIGVYPDEAAAVLETQKEHELGTFLVQKVEPGSGAYTQAFNSRVA